MEKNIVVINKRVLSETKTIEVTGDIIVPDIKPDIVSIINTNGIGYVYKEDLNTGRVRLDGNLDTYIIYLADNGETRSIQNTLTFSESMESSNIKETSFLKHQVELETIEAKVLNERKISISGKVKIKVEAFEKEEAEIPSALDNANDIEVLKENCEIKSLIEVNKIKTSIKEDISVDNSYDIAEILKTDIQIKNFENKISYNKVLAKADAEVKIIFLTEDNKIGVTQTEIPVMSFIDINNITDNDVCDVNYSIRNMLFKVNAKEMHSIACQIDFEVGCEAYQTRSLEIIEDMYGVKNNIDFTRRDIQVQIAKSEVTQNVNMNEKVLIEDVLNILDVNHRINVISTTKSGNYFNYECELRLEFYYEADNRNGLNVKNVDLPFMVKFEGEERNLEFNITNKKFTISNENVDCDIEILAKEVDSSLKKITIMDNIEITPQEEESDYKMFMYFVKPGDSIWKIAKKFKVPMCDIAKINNIEDMSKIDVGQRLYIMR